MAPSGTISELAFYYGGKHWLEDQKLIDWTKSLLLFLTGLSPRSPAEFDRLVNSDPILVQPLAESGLLINYEPDEVVSDNSYLDPVTGQPSREAIELAQPYIDAIFARSRSASVEPQLTLDSLITAIEADNVRKRITDAAVQPVTDDELMAVLVASMLRSYRRASKARVVTSDLKTIGIDFSSVSLDEVLDFRERYGAAYRSYARDLKASTLGLSLVTSEDQRSALQERARGLEDAVEDLRSLRRKSFGRSAIALAFGITGAAWILSQGDPVGAVLAGGAAIAGASLGDALPAESAYSYIFRATEELQR